MRARTTRRFLLLAALASIPVLASCVTCHCPQPAVATPTPAPPRADAPSGPDAPQRPVEVQGPRLPGPLGPALAPAPASLEAFVDGEGLAHAPFARFREAARRIEGARIRWRMHSWGGELSSVGYDTPSGRQPVEGFGRIRFVSERTPTNLSEVDDAGYPVVTCLARFPTDDDTTFVRSDDRREPTPGASAVVTVEGTVWGALREGGAPNLWLHDCAVVP